MRSGAAASLMGPALGVPPVGYRVELSRPRRVLEAGRRRRREPPVVVGIARGEISNGGSYQATTTEISSNFHPQTRLPGNSVLVAVKN